MRSNILILVMAVCLGLFPAIANDKSVCAVDSAACMDNKCYGRGSFAKGADVGWLSQMESEGLKFYTQTGVEKECMQLLRDDCGVNSIRLRVWVNPIDGWNNIDDVANKALRAKDLGLRLMIDFHFSDTWADPGHQSMPAAWEGKSLDAVADSVTAHVTAMMQRLKELNIEPEWVQIGNETTPGMMLPMGDIELHPDQYAVLNNAGYDAVKAVFPEALCIVHLDGGHDQWRYDRMFDALESNSGKYDMIGMSIYPFWAEQEGFVGGWQKNADDAIANINHLKQKYGKPVMVCEIGMPYDQPDACQALITKLMGADIEGIFYWEPEAPAGYNGGYNLGCFDNNAPTNALNPFKQTLKH